jgi:hypothetical integral membrane protein (TIGR02206 family)
MIPTHPYNVIFFGAFTLFGTEHLAALATLFTIGCVFIATGKVFRNWQDHERYLIASVLIFAKLARIYLSWHDRLLDWTNGLPMHLCDWATIAIIIALLTQKQSFYEPAYFWGLAGTIQALLTPDLTYHFPDPRMILFFVSHGFIVIGVFYMTLALEFRPLKGAIWRVFGLSQIYMAVTLLVNWAIGSNYGYLCHKPVGSSLLNCMGPWPYYLISLEALALIFYLLLYSPYFFMDRLSGSSVKPRLH